MYNWRYHIASLVSVFLALSVGLLLGSIVVERGVLNAQKTSLVDSIRGDLDKLRQDNRGLQARTASLSSFAKDAAPVLVAGLFEGRSVLVIADPDSAETAARASDAIRLAGGTPVTVTFQQPGLALGEQKVREAAMKALGSPEPSQLETRVVETLAKELTAPGDSRVLLSALRTAGGLTVSGLTPTATVGGVAVTAVWDGKPDTAAVRLARALAGPGRFAAGIETVKRRTGQSAAAVTAGLSAVDDVDEPIGQVSLVWVLAGRASGWFGSGAGATDPFPQPLAP